MKKLFIIFSIFFIIINTAKTEEVLDEGLIAYNNSKFDKAYRILKPLANSGNSEAQYYIADMYLNGSGIMMDKSKALNWYLKSANNNNAEAIYLLGYSYFNGSNLVSKDIAEALKWYNRGSILGNALSQNNLGLMYHEGIGVKKNIDKAHDLYKSASDQGEKYGQYNLSRIYTFGEGRYPQDIKKAVKLLELSASQGLDMAEYNLGWIYYYGQGKINKNIKKASIWFKKCADQYNAECQNYLGLIKENYDLKDIKGSPADYFELAARQGNVEAQYNLGRLFSTGAKKDVSKAIEWYNKAALKGSAMASYNTAFHYLNGDGVNKDFKEAMRQFTIAANLGLYQAQNNLGFYYSMGREGMEKNYGLAYYWYGVLVKCLANKNIKENLMSPDIFPYKISDVRSWKNTYANKIGKKEQERLDKKIALYDDINLKNNFDESVIVKIENNNYVADASRDYPEEDLKNPKGSPKLAEATSDVLENRIAIVIGNEAYKISPLKNPINDAFLMKKTLESFGFKVYYYNDLNYKQFRNAFYDFEDVIKESQNKRTSVLFYYSGHAFQYEGKNYLVPIDSKFDSPRDLDLELITTDRILGALEGNYKGVKIVLLDACRNSPFKSFVRGSRKTKGLTQIDAPSGTIIGYSTAPGYTSLDGEGNNSPYTLSLVKNIKLKGLLIEQVLKKTRIDVAKTTENEQIPWENSSLMTDFIFNK